MTGVVFAAHAKFVEIGNLVKPLERKAKEQNKV